jgi:hypothetical protein
MAVLMGERHSPSDRAVDGLERMILDVLFLGKHCRSRKEVVPWQRIAPSQLDLLKVLI